MSLQISAPWVSSAPLARGVFPMRATDAAPAAALCDALFGVGGDSGGYAVVDAALVPNLPELIETSGGAARSLFSGATEAEMAAHGPWLIALSATDRLSRLILTRSDAPWHLAGSGALILMRSPAGFDALRRHLRSIVSARDAAGRNLYFRFWQDPFLRVALTAVDHETALRLAPPQIIETLLLPQEDGFTALSVAPGPQPAPAPDGRFTVTDALHQAFEQAAIRRFETDLRRRFVTDQGMAPDLFRASLVSIAAAGFRDRAMIADLMALCHLAGGDVLSTDWARQSLADTATFAETSRWRALRLQAQRAGLALTPA